MRSTKLQLLRFVNGSIRSTLFPPLKCTLHITGSLKCMQKGDDPGKFRQVDDMLFIDGYPGYQQLMSVAENCMQVVCEVKGGILVHLLFTSSVWKLAKLCYDLSNLMGRYWRKKTRSLSLALSLLYWLWEPSLVASLLIFFILVFNYPGSVYQ